MSTAVLDIDHIKELNAVFSSLKPMKISTIKKVVFWATDKKNVDMSSKILQNIEDYKNTLFKNDFSLKDAKVNLQKTYKNKETVDIALNSIFETLDGDFDGSGEIQIDDKNMKAILSNLKTTQKKLEYLSDYLVLAIKVAEAKSSIDHKKKYTAEKFEDLINAA